MHESKPTCVLLFHESLLSDGDNAQRKLKEHHTSLQEDQIPKSVQFLALAVAYFRLEVVGE